MNKTISVNIGGRVFNIEENAYDKLNAYLLAIRSYFSESESTDEIIADIELRIAELFLERTTAQKQAITIGDVDEVIAIMGQPEDYADDSESEFSGNTENRFRRTGSKRIFRDPDDKILFGTCSGISAYFGWDPIILRAIFAVLFVFFGSGLLIYLILTVILPKAKTTAEKLEMHGEPVTVDNISRKVSESFEDVKQDIKDFGKKNNIKSEQFRSVGNELGNFLNSVGRFIMRMVSLVVQLIGKILGVVLFIAGIAGIMFLISALIGWETVLQYSNNGVQIDDQVRSLMDATFVSRAQQNLVIAGVFFVIFIPVLAFLLVGIRLLFDYRKIPGYAALILLVLWFCAVTLLATSGGLLAKEFHMDTVYSEKLSIQLPTAQTIVVDIDGGSEPVYRFRSGFERGRFFYSGAVTFPGMDSTNIVYLGKSKFTVAMNQTDTIPRMEMMRSASGNSQKDAMENAAAVESHIAVSNDTLKIHPYFALPKGKKLRAQEVRYTLYLPVGRSVYLTERTSDILDNIPNVSNTYDRRMVNHNWLMTREGLICTSCPEANASGQKDEMSNNSDTISRGNF